MAFRVFLYLFLFLLLSFPNFSHSSLQISWWFGEKKTYGSVLKLNKRGSSTGFDSSRVTQLSWHPRAFLYNGFLSEKECEHLINLARDKLEVSMVADNESGKSTKSEVRTSSGMFLNRGQDEVVKTIEARIAAWTLLPEENGESMQILRYEHGQKYEPHFDYFHDKANLELGGHRVATVLMYLSYVEKGGETVFPNSEAKVTQLKDETWSDCAKNGYAGCLDQPLYKPVDVIVIHYESLNRDKGLLSRVEYDGRVCEASGFKSIYLQSGDIFCVDSFVVKPKKGDALLFFSLHPDATIDLMSLHGSCPVIEGEKWSATKWIHVKAFDKPRKRTGGECVDEDANCPRWAAAGECQKNPLYMVGSEGSHGNCRQSCKVC